MLLGRRMRAARQERGLSTVQVARTVGVSPSLISQVERGLTAPSLDVLEGIARCLDVSIGSLLDGDAPPAAASGPPAVAGVAGDAHAASAVTAIPAGWDDLPLPPGPRGGQAGAAAGAPAAAPGQAPQGSAEVVRAGARKMLGLPGSVTYELLSPDLKHQIELIWVVFAPGQKGPIYSHEGEEQMVVVRGRMHYWVAGEIYVLEAGDCITIDASQPHSSANLDAEPATIIAAITPPSF
jgi:transcriptional regulator with XRE-family HTH domain/quercetin dioxygenase-like cupin family protein